MTSEKTDRVLLVSLCDCDLGAVLAEIGDHAEVETVRLSCEPARVGDLVARLGGRRLAVHAEDTVRLDEVVRQLRVPFALLPCATDPPSLSVLGVPGAGETGVRQLLAGQPVAAGVLRSDHGEFAAVRDVMLVRQGAADELVPFDAHVLVDGDEVFAGRVDGYVHLGVEFGRLHVEFTHDGETLEWTGAEVVVKAGAPVEAHDCVGAKPARLRHTWTVEPDGFSVYTQEAAEGVLVLACGTSDLTGVLDELAGELSVEVVELSATPSRADVEAALARARGRRVAVRAGREAFEFVVHHLLASGARTPLAVLPDPDDPVQLGPDGAPFNGSGVAQLLAGETATAPVLRGDAGETALSVNLWDAGPDEAAIPFAATILVDGDQVFDGVSDGVIRIQLDVVGDAEVEFAAHESDVDGAVVRRRVSGTSVTVESPALLEAADAVEIKGTGYRHVWSVEQDGFDIYVDPDEIRAVDDRPSAAELAEQREHARQRRLLADPPPATTSTGVLLLRMVVPILLVCGSSVTALAVVGTAIAEDVGAFAFVVSVVIAVLGYQLSGKHLWVRAAAILVGVAYVVVLGYGGRTLIENFALQLTGHEAEVGDRVTVIVDPAGEAEAHTREDMNRSTWPPAALLLGATVFLFVLSGLSWRKRRRADYAEYVALRDERTTAAADA